MGSPVLQIRLLGAFSLCYGEAPLPPFESTRAESLLAYLLVHRDAPQPRQRVAFQLWPDSTEPQARTNLRHLLHTLRRVLPDPDRFLDVTPRTLQWRPDAPVWLDVAEFAAALERAERDADAGIAGLREAVELYTGDLLDGCYDEWLLGERERLRTRYLDSLARLAALYEVRDEPAEAIRVAEQLLRIDPPREENYRVLMRLHDARGDRARALHVYHQCVATLERELGVAPAAATREVYEALLSRDSPPAIPERDGGRLGGPPFVGRGPERSRLANLWRATEAGKAQFVLVAGESGVGKTRLVEEFRSWCVHRGAVAASARSYAAEGDLAYATAVAWLRAEGLRSCLGRLDRIHLTELARLLPELLTTSPGLTAPEPLPEADQRRRVFEAIGRVICTPGTPLLLVADDLQWSDRETLQILHYLLRTEPDARLLVAATARSEEIDHWRPLHDLLGGLHALDRCTEIHLRRLTRAETVDLAERMADRPIAGPDLDRLYHETEGNPLFVVEAIRAGWRGGHGEPGRLSPKVQATIEARLGRLSQPARDLVGLASTIGREFTTNVLGAAAAESEDRLVRGLDELWRRDIIREQGADAYDFSHDKIREVAYRGLSPAQRRRHHRRVARALAQRQGHDSDPVSGQIAAHYESAGEGDEAVAWYGRAAEASLRLHANAETVRLLTRGLDILHGLPRTPERQTRELGLLAVQLMPLGWIDGWASERLARAQQRALEIGRALGGEPSAPLLRSLGVSSLAGRDFAAARGFGEQLRARGERDDDDMLLVEAAYVLGIAAFWQGEFAAARAYFADAIDRYRPDHRHTHLLHYGLDPKVVCLSRLGNTHWFLGQPAAATRARDAALALADEIGDPYSRAVALAFAALLALEMRDVEGVRAYAALLTTEQAKHEMRPNQVSSEFFDGFVAVLDGRTDTGLARIQHALGVSRDVDQAPGMRAYTTRVFLEACAIAGEARMGLLVADQALDRGGDDRIWEAETRRLRATFLAAHNAPAREVEAEYERALSVARRQGAAMLELRAATSLLQFRLDRGVTGVAEARERLATILEHFPEPANTLDFREAASLLDRG